MKSANPELAIAEAPPVELEQQGSSPASPTNFMAVIARAAADPNVNVDKMERLYAMMEKENARIAEQKFNEAMAKAQSEMPMVIKKSINPQTQSRYAKLEAVKIAIAPVVKDNGFSLMFSEGKSDNTAKIRILCDVNHAGGHSMQRYMDLSPDDVGAKGNASKTKIHGEGSTFSYGCRYLTTMLFNVIVIGEDNDGNQSHRPRPAGPTVAEPKAAVEPKLDQLKKELWKVTQTIHNGDAKTLQQWLWDELNLDPARTLESLNAAELQGFIAIAKRKLHV